MSTIIIEIIFAVCMYPVLPIIYYVMRSDSTSKKNVILGVTIPFRYAEDSEVKEICRQYDKKLNLYTFIYAILPISFFFIKHFSISFSLWMIWLLIVISLSFWPFINYHNKLRQLKAERQWEVENTGKTIIDLQTAAEKIRTTKTAFFLPPILLSLVPCVYELFHASDSSHFIANLIVLLSIGLISPLCYAIGILMDRQKSEVISLNSTSNLNFNRAKKHIWSRCFLVLAWANTAFTFTVWIFTRDIIKSALLFMLSIIAYTVVDLFICIRSSLNLYRIRQKAINETIENSSNVLTDDDANWIYGMIYYNPNDKHFMVDKRIGIGSTVNVATTAGKWLTGFAALALLAIPAVCVLVIFEEFTPINLKVENNQIVAEHLKTEYSIDLDDIREIKLITTLPETDRNNGTGMENLEKGDFTVEGYGDCKLCLDPQNGAFIVIKTDKRTYIVSDQDDNGTKQVYEDAAK